MANPSKLTVNDLVAHDKIAYPSGDAIDTAGTVPIKAVDLEGRADLLVLDVTETGTTNTFVLTFKAGDNPPAIRAPVGDLEISLAASEHKVIGPLEAARFLKNDGDIDVAFSSDGTPAGTVRVYRLPKAV